MKPFDFMSQMQEATKRLFKVLPDNFTGNDMNAISGYVGAICLCSEIENVPLDTDENIIDLFNKAKAADERFLANKEHKPIIDWDREKCWDFIYNNRKLLRV